MIDEEFAQQLRRELAPTTITVDDMGAPRLVFICIGSHGHARAIARSIEANITGRGQVLCVDEPFFYSPRLERESLEDRMQGLADCIAQIEAPTMDLDDGPGYGPPPPPNTERLKRKAQWKRETAWSRRK